MDLFERQLIWIKNPRQTTSMCFFLNSLRVGGRKSWSWFFFWVPKERSLNMCNWTTWKKPSRLSLSKVQEKLKVIRKTWLQFFFGPWGEVYLYFRLLLTVEDLPPTWIAGLLGGQTPNSKPAEVWIFPTWGSIMSCPQISKSPSNLETSNTVQLRSFANELLWFLLAWNCSVARS